MFVFNTFAQQTMEIEGASNNHQYEGGVGALHKAARHFQRCKVCLHTMHRLLHHRIVHTAMPYEAVQACQKQAVAKCANKGSRHIHHAITDYDVCANTTRPHQC